MTPHVLFAGELSNHNSTETAEDTARPLKVIIIGAGIAGLTAAIGIRRAGHEVEVSPLQPLANIRYGYADHL